MAGVGWKMRKRVAKGGGGAHYSSHKSEPFWVGFVEGENGEELWWFRRIPTGRTPVN